MLKNDINIPLLATTTLISCIVLVVLLVGVHAWYLYEVENETQDKWPLTTTIKHVEETKTQQLASISSPPKWVKPDSNVIGLPIERTMAIIAEKKGVMPTTQP